MQSQLIIATIALIAAQAGATAVSGNSQTVQVTDGVTVQGNGSAVVTGQYTPGQSIDGTVQANGNGQANVDGFGTVKVAGAVDAAGHADATGANVRLAMDGEASGPYGAFARGAVAGSGFADAKTGTAGVQGAINGQAGADGYSVAGAADGSVSGGLNGKFMAAGAVNGCLKRPNGSQDCYAADGSYIGTINADGSVTGTGTGASTSSSTGATTGSSSTTSTTSTPAKNAADTVAASSLFAVLAGLAAFAL